MTPAASQNRSLTVAAPIRAATVRERSSFFAPAGGFVARQVVRVAVLPVRRIAWRAEFVGAENPPVLAGTRHGENQGQVRTGTLEVGDADAVYAAAQRDVARLGIGAVETVIADHFFAVDI